MKKILTMTLLSAIILCMFTDTAMSAERKIGTADTHEEILKQITIWEPDSNEVFNSALGSTIPELPPITVLQGGKPLKGTYTYPDYDSSVLGISNVLWVFTPEDITIEQITGMVKVNIVKPYSEEDEIATTPSLTATTVLLDTSTTYDINLDNKVAGSSYEWTSSDTDIVEVNSKSGLLKAKGSGKADVTCKITLPDESTKILVSEVIVGYDDNAPLLTEATLDLETGDVFDINLENKVAKSKYRWASSNRNVAKVNSSNGKVSAIASGSAFVTCTITTPENQVIVLRCDISVTAHGVVTE